MSIPLPAWIDPEAWAGFVAMRKAMPKTRPFTDRAAMLILKELYRLKEAGYCPNACLDQSTLRGWADVYATKDKQIQMTAEASYEQQQKREREEAERRKRETFSPQSEAARAEAMARLGKPLRRVA